jgi:hypothetical protein
MGSYNKYQYVLKWAKRKKAVDRLGGKCIGCGNDNFLHLEFHHPNPDKEVGVADLGNYRWSKVIKEVDKCELFCRNCHSEYHYKNGRASKVKNKILTEINRKSCEHCGYEGKNLKSLEFHHLGEKRFNISDVFARRVNVELQTLIDEISECEIVCRNCHYEEHIHDKIYDLMDLIEAKANEYIEKRGKIDRREIKKMYDEGHTVTEISKYFQCAKSTISMALKRMLEDKQ